MKQFIHAAAIGCSLPLVRGAGSFKWNVIKPRDVGTYIPAHETGEGRQIQTLAMGPATTSPPQLMGGRSGSLLAERQNSDDHPASVCGYIEGDIEYPFACAVTDSCLLTTIGTEWVAGCCPTTSLDCYIATTCIDSSVWATMSESDIGVETYSCTYSDYPYCLTMTYDDLPGYSVMNCAKSSFSTPGAIDYEPTTSTGSVTSRKTTTSGIFDITSADGASTTSSTGSTGSSSSSSNSNSSLPIGPIVGGAVGGIAILALLILGLVLILRRRKNSPSNNGIQPGPPPVTGGPPPPMDQQWQQPPMEQQWQQPPPASGFQPNAAGYVDNRISMQQPQYDFKSQATQSVYDPTLAPSPGSPPPLQQQQSPAPQYLPPSNVSTPPPQQGQGVSPVEPSFQTGPNQGFQQQQHDMTSYHELPITRADGQLRELA